MTRIEITVNSITKEIEKYTKQLEQRTRRLEKGFAQADKIGHPELKEWTGEDERKFRSEFVKAEKEFEEWLKRFKAECLKDGIIIEEYHNAYMYGTTRNGKPFYLEINNGWTTRSLHCYTLKIDGKTMFTSGTFIRAYNYLRTK